MQHMWQPSFWGASMLRHVTFAALAAGVLASGCGGSDSEAPAVDTEATEQAPDESAPDPASSSVLQLAIDGREISLGASARLLVLQGVDSVHLAISGADAGDDFVLFDIEFDGLDRTMGTHLIDFGLPDQVVNHANVSLDGDFYYSQGGQIELTLHEDGQIDARFTVALAPDDAMPGAIPVALEASDDPTTLSGSFSGRWVLSCHSRLAGHDSLVVGGEFCENLDF